MYSPESYILEALEMVESWDLPDEAIAHAANQQARLMCGLLDMGDHFDDLTNAPFQDIH